MTNPEDAIAAMSDRQVLLTLQALAYELHEALPVEERDLITDEDTAAEVLTSALGTPEQSDGTEADTRQLLRVAVSDAVIGPVVRPLIEDPPRDEQMVIPILTAAIVLGAIVAMLQTRVHVEINRHDGKTDIGLLFDKRAAEPSEVRAFLGRLGGAATGDGGQ